MKRLLNYLPLHFVAFVILGICCQFFTEFWTFGFLNLFLILIIFLFLLLVKSKILATIVSFWLFFFIGVSAVFLNDDRNYDDFYVHHIKDNSSRVLQIYKTLKSGHFHNKYLARVIQLSGKKTRGSILLNIVKDSLSTPLKVDEVIMIRPDFKALNPPLNPHQFDYKYYLFKQGIHHQIFTEDKRILKLNYPKFSLFGLSAKTRFNIQKSLENYNFTKDELAVINALLLGQRQDISKELITNYQNAGAIHILAVSGLHVGIILLLLSFICKPLEHFKYGNFLKTILIILLLWCFAFIAGLSASVVRAVTMFSFVAIGMSFKQKNIVEFSFISSLFFLLLIKPMFLFDVGFQLSYLAVFGILYAQPKIYKIWKPKYRIVDFFWQLFTVSLAAQVGILPLSIYYFKQFPGLFLASNLVIIPFLGVILIAGIVVIVLALVHFLPQFLADLYGNIIALMNVFVGWISHQESFLFKEISISIWMMLLWYVLLFTGVYLLFTRSAKKLLYFLFAVVLVQSFFLYERVKSNTKREFIVYHKSRFSIIGKRLGNQLYVQHPLDSSTVKNDYSVKNYRVAEYISKIQNIDFKNYLKFANKDVLLIDSLGVYKIDHLKNPIVILQYSPKINLERLIKRIKPSQIIADGSNYKSYVLRWRKSCLKESIPFHYTGKKGAYILREKD